jgi:hypothetical protein
VNWFALPDSRICAFWHGLATSFTLRTATNSLALTSTSPSKV